ncbi:MAG: ABC transporter permease subunit [Chloroflexi bacterium]|uniref:Spermidine/putrescine ABC transporter permease PotC n=1 Tax=Candidatus Thermofonsia Clade 3 bacterium TaxID=2364212 RepID=A0A2M8QGI8_9CHLR|nr:MAG: spermidine/putrescine ABC transporter permease PotC [Candidatus Thermofonsia Clade 3 bacterium]RMG66116.1 MAG: ABC transporter permease subunit [Chloroflexota bacterium]
MGRFALVTIALFTFAFLYVPIVVLIVFSFNSARTGATWQSFTLQWYDRVFSNTRILEAAANSLIVATLSTLGAVVIGTLMAMAMERYRFRGQSAWDGLLYLPVIVPEIVMGISLLIFFAAVNISRGLLTLIISHIAFCMPFVYLTMRARLADFDRSVEEAAQDLGANEWVTFRRVTLPLLMPGIISSALLAFTLSLDDFVISFFVTGVGSQTLPVYIWGQIRRGITPEINAISALMLVLSIVLVIATQLIQHRQRT